MILHIVWQWASYQIRKIAGCACAGNAGNVFPRRWFQMKPLVSDPGMHHGTCVTHVPWCMSGSLTCGDGENVPGIPGACAPAILRIWQEAHRPTSQIPQCIKYPTMHHFVKCAHFKYEMMHCRIWDWCIVGFVRQVYCELNKDQGAVSIRKTVLPGMAIPMLKIRRPNGRLIFNMENAIRR